MESGSIKENVTLISLVTLTTLAVTFALYFMRPVLVPFVFSIFLYFALNPITDFFQKRIRLPKAIGLALTLCVFGIVFFLVSMILSFSIKGFINGSDVYRDNLLLLLDEFTDFSNQYGYNIDLTFIRQSLLNLPLITWIRNLSGSLVKLTGNILLILIFTFFLVLGNKSNEESNRQGLIGPEIQTRISRYVFTKMLTSFSTGVLVGIILQLFNVELAFMFAILTFFLNFIPNIGSIIATLLPIPVLLLQFGTNWVFLTVLIITGIIQFLIGNVIEPKIMGENLGLHPAIVLLSLLFWGFIWKVPGMFLAVPMTAVIKFILSRYTLSEPIAKLLEGNFKA